MQSVNGGTKQIIRFYSEFLMKQMSFGVTDILPQVVTLAYNQSALINKRVDRDFKVQRCRTLADTTGSIVVRAVARAIVASKVTY